MRDRLAAAGANPNDDLGAMTREIADELIAAARAGDRDKTDSLVKLVDQVEGPQKQSIDVQAEVTARVLINGFDVDDAPPSGETP